MLADAYDAFLFDLDGVLYRGPDAVPHAAEAVAALRGRGKATVFLTNNSARTPDEVAVKLAAVGVEADPADVVTSAQATAALIAGEGGSSAFVVGERGVREALEAVGVRIEDGEPDRVDHVVVGWDRAADYEKLRVASLLVQRGARLVATNPDASYPAPDGLVWPGAGALLAVVTATTGVEPRVVGKPHAPLFLLAHERGGGGRPLVIGDRLETDIAGGAALGWDSLLVLTGVATAAEARAADPRPTYVADDLRALTADPGPDRSTPSGPAGTPPRPARAGMDG